ncbi:MAG: response regulator transcription factor [Alphaproteobacteria bacterium]|nr:response regulator transcription factor [Alphaproteobacteria bacterium]
MQHTILVVDDDPVLNEGVSKALRAQGYAVTSAANAERALEFMKLFLFDALVLDRMMPGMDGVELLKLMRAKNIKTPVLMLTALGDTDNTIQGLSCGADDYMGKPFSVKELTLRMKNLLSRSGAKKTENNFEWLDGEFLFEGRAIPLSENEKAALRELTSPIGAIARAAPMTIKRLREKLSGCNITVTTVHGKGYRIIKCD